MKSTRTNLSINIQFNNVQEVEAVLYQILNELSGPAIYGSGKTDNVEFNFVRESFTIEALTNGKIVKNIKSKF